MRSLRIAHRARRTMSKQITHGSRWHRTTDVLPMSVTSTAEHWDLGSLALALSCRCCRTAAYTSSSASRFTNMLLSPRPFGSRLVVHLEVHCLELRPTPLAIQSVRDTAHLFESYGSSVQVALVMGTMAGSVYALLEPEDDPLKLLPRLVPPRLSMPKGICHSDEAPTGSYTLDLPGSASAYPWHYPGPWLLGPSCTRQACG